MNRRLIYLLLSISLILLWQYFGSHSQTVRLLISSPAHIWQYFTENIAILLAATKTTLVEAFSGLLIATFFSFAAMTFCFYKPKIMEFVLPIMVTSQVIPLIVLAPFFIILFGIGLGSKIAMAALMCFFPIFVNFAQGYKSISSNVHELMHIYNAPLSFRIKNVYFPLAMPSIMAGLKISATLAVIGAIVAEFNGADIGLGKNLFIAAKRLEPDLMMTSLILSTILGGFSFFIIYLIERRVGHWYSQENLIQTKNT